MTFKEFLAEAKFDISGAVARAPSLSLTTRKQQPSTSLPLQTQGPMKATPMRSLAPVQKTTSATVSPSTPVTSVTPKPAVTTRNVPSTTFTGKNGNLSPSQLVKVGQYDAGAAGRSQWYGTDAYLEPKAAQAFKAAQQDFGGPIKINSAYRNIAHQQGLSKEGHKVVGRPGRSMHGIGKALDLQRGTPEYSWMKTNGPKYGWHFASIPGDPHHFEYKG